MVKFDFVHCLSGGSGWDWDSNASSPSFGMPSLSIIPTIGFYESKEYKDLPKWSRMMGYSGQFSASIGPVGGSYSLAFETDDRGKITGVGQWETFGLQVTPGAKGPSFFSQITYTFPIIGAGDD